VSDTVGTAPNDDVVDLVIDVASGVVELNDIAAVLEGLADSDR